MPAATPFRILTMAEFRSLDAEGRAAYLCEAMANIKRLNSQIRSALGKPNPVYVRSKK